MDPEPGEWTVLRQPVPLQRMSERKAGLCGSRLRRAHASPARGRFPAALSKENSRPDSRGRRRLRAANDRRSLPSSACRARPIEAVSTSSGAGRRCSMRPTKARE
jgi:hypothetical protein